MRERAIERGERERERERDRERASTGYMQTPSAAPLSVTTHPAHQFLPPTPDSSTRCLRP